MARMTRRVVLAAAPLVPLAPYLTRSIFAQHHGEGASRLYIGTYTHEVGPGNKGEGIYTAEWDATAGAAHGLQLAAKSDDPSYLAAVGGRDAIYAVNETESYPQKGGGKGGSVSAFARGADGKLSEQNAVPSGGSGPCYITLDRAGRQAFVANYNNGTAASFRVTPMGVEGPVTVFVAHGSGPNEERQKGPHIHCTTLSPDERYLLVSDLGTDQIWIFHIDAKTAEIKETGKPFHAKPGSGPRHTHFHPNGKWVYSINEMAATVDALKWNAQAGTLEFLSDVPLRDASSPADSTGAELAIDRTGRFLYASHRTENTLVVFSIDAKSGALKFVQRISSGGKNPRDFTLDPSEKWVVAANQDSQNVVVFARDAHTGKLTQTVRSYRVGAPVAVLFV